MSTRQGENPTSPPATTRISAPDLGSRISLLVLDPSGASVHDAVVESCRALGRVVPTESFAVVARSDKDGVANVVQSAPDDPPPSRLVVSHEGFASKSISEPAWGDKIEVRLEQAHTLEARVVDREGKPVPGALLFLSRSPVRGVSFDPVSREGPNEEDRIHAGTSDSNGVIAISGLRPARYDFRITHRSLIWQDAEEQFSTPGITVPRMSLTFTMWPTIAVWKRIVGRKVLAMAYSFRQGDSNWHGEEIRNSIHKRHRSGQGDVVCAIADHVASGSALSVHAFLQDAGWFRYTWRFAPCDFGAAVDEVPWTDGVPLGGEAGTLELDLTDGAGEQLNVDTLWARSVGGHVFSVALANRSNALLPEGAYQMVSSDNEVGRAIAGLSVDIAAGSPCVVRQQLGLRPYTLRFLRANGAPVVGGVMTRLRIGERPDDIFMRSDGDRIYLPDEVVEIESATEIWKSVAQRIPLSASSVREIVCTLL